MNEERKKRPGSSSVSPGRRIGRLILGIVGLALFAGIFASGWTPPGMAGRVLRHNQQHQIDASPLFYSEVEHMADLEKGVKQLRKEAAKSTLGQVKNKSEQN
jgi:anti-sigma factor RsiW